MYNHELMRTTEIINVLKTLMLKSAVVNYVLHYHVYKNTDMLIRETIIDKIHTRTENYININDKTK